ncbi:MULTISPECIES: helix-turn-helix domain-containing protein [unclassified Paenibacillus]|uniref:helix-turn-helix domain-containing protein n=1 Tax=unclassified Paenibacillus TaxID=185978 RepID=UPI0030F74EA9
MNFTAAVKEAMDAKGMSRADLARATGRSYQYISDLLKGERRWHELIINEVCEALEIKIEITSISSDEKEVEHEQIASN